MGDWRRVLGQHVRQQRDLRAHRSAFAQGGVGITLDDALVGNECAGQDVRAHEDGTRDHCDRDGGAGVRAQDVDANGERRRNRVSHGSRRHGHRGDRHRFHAAWRERGIAEVLDDDAVDARFGQDTSVLAGPINDRRYAAAPPWRPGQGCQVNHPDERPG